MGEAMLPEIETRLLSALLKSAELARGLLKAGLRPDLLPSPEGRELARLILRVRDAAGDVTGAVEDQIGEAAALDEDAARLLALVRHAPCPGREEALAYLALFELTETAERCRSGPAGAAETPLHRPSALQDPPPGASLHSLRRIHLPEPTASTPGEVSEA